jgi:hypothetical protein
MFVTAPDPSYAQPIDGANGAYDINAIIREIK